MVSDGLDAVVHGALVSSVVHASDGGMAVVCNRGDDPFLHIPTLVINNRITMVVMAIFTHRSQKLGRLGDYHLVTKLHQCIVHCV